MGLAETSDARLKLDDTKRADLQIRVLDRVRNCETLEEIAKEFGVSSHWARHIARTFKPQDNSPGADTHGA